jgi:hypothetical protein
MTTGTKKTKDKGATGPANGQTGATGPTAAPYNGPKDPPYKVAVKSIGPDVYTMQLGTTGPLSGWVLNYGLTVDEAYANLEAQFGTGTVYPPQPVPGEEGTEPSTTDGTTGGLGGGPNTTLPLDPRLIFNVADDGTVVYSFCNAEEIQSTLTEGFVISIEGPTAGNTGPVSASNPEVTAKQMKDKAPEHWGVPSLMNYNAYINLQAAAGRLGNKYLIDRENQPRWYDVTANVQSPNAGATGGVGGSGLTTDLSVSQLVEWCERPGNTKFPYRYQDFVFLKYWKKIPLNYMITLRRYTFPVIDNVGTVSEAKGDVESSKLTPAATAITFLGEDPGNKISTILGPISAGLKWKEVKADVWEVNFSGSLPQANGPAPGFAAVLGYLTGGPAAAKPSVGGGPPPDPYNNGPYANKILGPVTVIDSTKARERGVTFKHEIKLQFEYVARSIGGINSKAAMLDILGNLMLLTYNEAAFWGGMNRYMPMAAQGGIPPFLGGSAGRDAWMKGDVDGFFNALGDQFASALENVGDMFQKFFDDPIGGLKSIASGALSGAMLMNTTQGMGFMQGIHSLLTGDPVGEWHLTVGNPLNPMMMIGNLICTGIEISFNDELGPDDFPTELKAVVTLEHGMPRDRAGIESMFNKGSGRVYSVPKGYENSFSSYNTTAVDTSTGGTKSGPNPWGESSGVVANRNGKGMGGSRGGFNNGRSGYYGRNPLLGDPRELDNVKGYYTQSVIPRLKNTLNATISAGVKWMGK